MIVDMRLKLALISAVALPFGLLAVPSTNAAPGWLAPDGVSQGGLIAEGSGSGGWAAEHGGISGSPRVAFDARGDAMTVWQHEDGTVEGTRKYAVQAAKYAVQAAFRPAGGAWEAPETISVPDGSDESAESASVAFDGRGDAFALWDAYSGSVPEGDAHFRVQAAFRPAGGAWQAPVDLSPVEAPGSGYPQLAVDERGDAIAIWTCFGGPIEESFRPAGGVWGAPVVVSDTGSEPEVVLDGQGDALAVWDGWPGVESAFMPAGGSWQASVEVSGSGVAGGLHVAVNGRGDAAAIWEQWTSGFLSPGTVQTAFRPAGGVWQAPVNIIGEREEEDQPKGAEDAQIAVDELGDEVAVWRWGFGPLIQAAFKPADGAWEAPPVDLSAFSGLTSAENPDVAFDDRGDALAVWSEQSSPGAPPVVQAAFKPAGGVWHAPTDISGPAWGDTYRSGIAFDEQGDAITVWVGEHGVEAAGYAATGPTLNDVSIAAEGAAGQPVTFSVSPFDVWSIDGETSWSFGDGASASGTSVTHTYATAGTYEVTLHSADTLGNVTSTTGKVTIASASATPAAPTPATASPAPTIVAADQSASILRYIGKRPVGITFSVALNEQAMLSFSFVQRSIGRMMSDKCVATTSRNAGRETCKRDAVAGAFSFAGHSGTNRVVFDGRIPHSKKLKPGRYTLVITATNTAGQHSSPKSLSFTIVSPVARPSQASSRYTTTIRKAHQ
jgi:PKD domain